MEDIKVPSRLCCLHHFQKKSWKEILLLDANALQPQDWSSSNYSLKPTNQMYPIYDAYSKGWEV